MFSRLTSRLRDRRDVLRASITPSIEALERRQMLTAATNPGGAPNAPFAVSASPAGPSAIQFSFIDSADNETGFVIRRAAGSNFVDIATLPASTPFHATVTYTDTNVVPGVNYTYEAYAINGPYNSSFSPPVGIQLATDGTGGTTTNPGGAPNAPFALTASPRSSFGISFAFYDSATNETGFVVQRSTSATGPFTTLATLAASPGSGQQVIYTDSSPSSKIPYYYRVFAVNGIYQSSIPAPVSATPQNIPPAAGLSLDTTFAASGDFHDASADGAVAVAVSPDGGTIYAAANGRHGNNTGFAGPIVDIISPNGTDNQLFVNVALSARFDNIAGLAVQPDGKLLVAGNHGNQIVVARFNTDGSLDPTFGNSAGELIVAYGSQEKVAGIALAPNGKIYVGGSHFVYLSPQSEFFAVRLNANGSLDSTYGYNGISKGDAHDTLSASAIAIDPVDGSVIVVGSALNAGAGSLGGTRLLANGTAINSFSYDPGFGSNALDVIVQPDRKIVVAGQANFAAGALRLNPDGSQDPTWIGPASLVPPGGGFGVAALNGIAQLPDGSYVAVGFSATAQHTDALIAHLAASDGSIETNGSQQDIIYRDLPDSSGSSNATYSDVSIAPDSSIYAAGSDHGTLLVSKYQFATGNPFG